MTPQEHRAIVMALTGMVMPVNELFWGYLSLVLERKLTEDDRQYIRREILGWRT